MLADTTTFSSTAARRLTSQTDASTITTKGIYVVRSAYRCVCVSVCLSVVGFRLHRLTKPLVTLNDSFTHSLQYSATQQALDMAFHHVMS